MVNFKKVVAREKATEADRKKTDQQNYEKKSWRHVECLRRIQKRI